jgi:lysophospholipase
LIILIKKARASLPLFIYGHSLGGLVTIKLLLEKSNINVSGCIITSPLLGLAKNLNLNWIKRQFVHYLGDHLSDFIINSQVNPTALTKKTIHMHTIFEDRLILPFLSVKMAKHIFDAIDYVSKKGKEFRYPIIIFHGKLDTVTDTELSINFVETNKRSFK